MSFIEITTVEGNLAKDPQTNTVGDKTVTNLTLMVNYKTKSGNTETEHTRALNVAFWGKSGEIAADKLKKGDAVIIFGGYHHVKKSITDDEVYFNEEIRNAVALS